MFWLFALLTMAAVGATHWTGEFGGLAPNRNSADASSEAVFAAFTQQRDVPQRLRELVADLPGDGPLLVLRTQDRLVTVLPGLMVAHEFCRRPVVVRETRLLDSAATVEELRKTFHAVIFVGQRPPTAFPPAQRIGLTMFFVRLR